MLELSDLLDAFQQFTRETNIEVTRPAQQLIVDLINNVETDLHETWELQEYRLDAYYQQWSAILPELLMRIAIEHHLSRKITMIDIVYWTGNHLEDQDLWKNCPLPFGPFPSEGELPPTMGIFPWNVEKRQW